MPVSSTVTPRTAVKGKSQSSRSFFDHRERTRDEVSKTTLSPPGESRRWSTSESGKRNDGARLTDVSNIGFIRIRPIIQVFHPILTEGLTSRIGLRDVLGCDG